MTLSSPLASIDLEYAGTVQRLELKPDDILVLKVPCTLQEDTAKRLRTAMEETFPGYKVIVLGDGLDLSVISPQ
jgi:hypothetical protein